MQGLDVPSWLAGALYTLNSAKNASHVDWILPLGALVVSIFSLVVSIASFYRSNFHIRHSLKFAISNNASIGNQEPKPNIIRLQYPPTSPPTMYEHTTVIFLNDGTESEIISGVQVEVDGGGFSHRTLPYVLESDSSIVYVIPFEHKLIRQAAISSQERKAFFKIRIFFYVNGREIDKTFDYGEVQLTPLQLNESGGFSGIKITGGFELVQLISNTQ